MYKSASWGWLLMPRILWVAFMLISSSGLHAQTGDIWSQLSSEVKDPVFQEVFCHPEKYRLQIIYTQINRDKNNQPHFTRYTYHEDPNQYFNPASTVKMPLAALTLQKLHSLNRLGIHKFTTMLTDSSSVGETAVSSDSTAPEGHPTLAQYIKRIFLVSDNEAYNRLYEFLGQQYINRSMRRLGYKDIRITRRFAPMNDIENRYTNAVRFLDNKGQLIYQQPPAYNRDSFQFGPEIKIGKAYMDSKDSLIQGPWDFTKGNHISLDDLTNIAGSVLFPGFRENSSGRNGRQLGDFNLTSDDRHFLWQYMSQYPGETNYPKYDSSVFYDSFTKFYFRAGSHQLPDYVREFNKPGWAYGFLTDIAYITDFKHHIEFMLSCTLYVNSDDIINDNHYDYDTVGFPFLYALGQGIYQYELKRPRKYQPDLSAFLIRYEHRSKADQRALIKVVDN